MAVGVQEKARDVPIRVGGIRGVHTAGEGVGSRGRGLHWGEWPARACVSMSERDGLYGRTQ